MLDSVSPTSMMASPTPDSQVLTPQAIVQHVFSTTSCYELMQSSSKGTVFETTIPFQLAFFALVEHDTDVAPLWDPELRAFVGLMTVGDYVRALRICHSRGLSASELTAQPIAEILSAAPQLFKHAGPSTLEAEEPVSALCLALLRGVDYVCILCPETGALVSILGPLDVLHLLSVICRHPTHETLFTSSIQSLRIGTYENLLTSPLRASVMELQDALEARDLSAAPVFDANAQRVVGLYHKNEVSFCMKASDPEAAIAALRAMTVDEALLQREGFLAAGDLVTPNGVAQTLPVYVKATDSLASVIAAMVQGRSHRALVMDVSSVNLSTSLPTNSTMSSLTSSISNNTSGNGSNPLALGRLVGIVSFRDVVQYFLDLPPAR